MYELEKMNDEIFLNIIKNTYENSSLDDALKLVKKSGICVNFFGTGRPKNPSLYKKAMNMLLELSEEESKIRKFEKEVAIINKMYEDFSNIHLREIEELLSDENHVSAYLIALELFLSNDINTFKVRSQLNNNRADIYENIAESSGKVLQYLLKYKKFPLNSTVRRIEIQDVKNARKHIQCSEIRELLDTVRELWSYFELELKEEEIVIAVSNGERALGKTISHLKFMDVRNAKQARYAHQQHLMYGKGSTLVKTRKLAPNDFISYNERMACEFVEEYFSTDNLELEFKSISIAEFIRAYSIISVECEKFLKKRKLRSKLENLSINDICIAKTRRKWIYLFVEYGIKQVNAERIFDLLVFGESSNDLFDCPLLKVGEDYIVIPSISFSTDPSRALLSNLKSKEIDVNIKGNLFEEQLRTTLNSIGLKCIQLVKPKYECDAVFSLNSDLFFVEAKHYSDPTSYREYMRNLDELQSAALQLDRIVEHYSQDENLILIQEKLKLEKINCIYRIVVTNTCQGENMKIGNTYIIDDISFSGYFLRKSPLKNEVQNYVVVSEPLFDKYYTGNINSKQFMTFVKDNPYIEHYKKRIEYHTFDYTKQIGLKLQDFGVKINTIVNIDKLSSSERKELDELSN